MGYPSAAIHYFRLLESDYPESRWVVRGRFEWARCGYDIKSYTEAKAMADTCGLLLGALEKREQANFVRTEPFSVAYRVFHLFGVIPYDSRTDIKVFIDDLRDDLDDLSGRIRSRLSRQARAPEPESPTP